MAHTYKPSSRKYRQPVEPGMYVVHQFWRASSIFKPISSKFVYTLEASLCFVSLRNMSCGSSASCRLLLWASVSDTCRLMCLWLYSVACPQSSFRTRSGDWQLPSLPSGTWSVLFCTYIQYMCTNLIHCQCYHIFTLCTTVGGWRLGGLAMTAALWGDDRLLECGWLLCLKGNSCSLYCVMGNFGLGCCETSLLTESRGFAQPMKLGFPHRKVSTRTFSVYIGLTCISQLLPNNGHTYVVCTVHVIIS